MSVEADMPQVARTARRAELLRLLDMRARVRVTNPAYPGGGWPGRLAGMLDEPSLIIDLDNGRRHVAPQSFAVTETREEPGAEIFVAVRQDDLRQVLRYARPVTEGGVFSRLAYAAGFEDGEAAQ